MHSMRLVEWHVLFVRGLLLQLNRHWVSVARTEFNTETWCMLHLCIQDRFYSSRGRVRSIITSIVNVFDGRISGSPIAIW